MDITTLNSAITLYRSAVDGLKVLQNLDVVIKTGELHAKIAQLQREIRDLGDILYDTRDAIREKDQEITNLKATLALKGNLVRNGDAYYLESPAIGYDRGPYCQMCYDKTGNLIHMFDYNSSYYCRECHAEVKGER